jgi:hypothetical protein
MNVPSLGPLHVHSQVPEWLESEPISVQYFDGHRLRFVLDGLSDADEADTISTIDAFLSFGSRDRIAASDYVFAVYRNVAQTVDADDLECTIRSKDSVWEHVRPTEVYVSRRHRRDRDIYVQITAECDWEPEHGLQIVYRRGRTIVRVSEQDGHLTYTDACDLPESEDRIVEGPVSADSSEMKAKRPWWKIW